MGGSYQPDPYRSESSYPAPTRPAVNVGRLWSGGLATALVAALVAAVGTVLLDVLFGVAVVVAGGGEWHAVDAGRYALGAGLGALAATGLMHLLLAFTPRPVRFFSWIVGLVTVLTMAAPFATGAHLADKVATSLLNLVIGAAIGSLVTGTARTAVRAAADGPAAPGR